MANRSYLYASSFDRSQRAREEADTVTGLSEFNYDIPLSFLLLMTGDPRVAKSIIWDFDGDISIIGDLAVGKQRLFNFMEQLPESSVDNRSQLFQATKEFLTPIDLPFIVLECGELYEMDDEDFEKQNQNTLQQIIAVDAQANSVLNQGGGDWDELGFGNWSDILYFDLRSTSSSTE